MTLPIEAGIQAIDPVYIANRIPQLQNKIAEQLQFLAGQMYIGESLNPEDGLLSNKMKEVASQSLKHLAILITSLEQLEECVLNLNGNTEYYKQMVSQFEASNAYAWLAYKEFMGTLQSGAEAVVKSRWVNQMKLMGKYQQVSKGLQGDVSDLTKTDPMKEFQTTDPTDKIKAPELKPDKDMDRIRKPQQVIRNDIQLDAADFKKPAIMPITDEIRGCVPVQAMKAEERQRAVIAAQQKMELEKARVIKTDGEKEKAALTPKRKAKVQKKIQPKKDSELDKIKELEKALAEAKRNLEQAKAVPVHPARNSVKTENVNEL